MLKDVQTSSIRLLLSKVDEPASVALLKLPSTHSVKHYLTDTVEEVVSHIPLNWRSPSTSC